MKIPGLVTWSVAPSKDIEERCFSDPETLLFERSNPLNFRSKPRLGSCVRACFQLCGVSMLFGSASAAAIDSHCTRLHRHATHVRACSKPVLLPLLFGSASAAAVCIHTSG